MLGGYDESKRKYYVQGNALPPAPELSDQHPNGWSLLDYLTAEEVDELSIVEPTTTTRYSIEWLVPKHHSLSREAYWDKLRLEDGKYSTSSEQGARRFLAKAHECIPEDRLRLVKIVETVHVLEEVQPSADKS